MKKSDLLLKIKEDLEQYKSKMKFGENIDKTNSMIYIMSKYNRDNFDEIMELSVDKLDDNISIKELNDFKKRINYFFSLNASEDDKFNQFICCDVYNRKPINNVVGISVIKWEVLQSPKLKKAPTLA